MITLASGRGGPAPLAVTATNVYWSDNAGIVTESIHGGTPDTLVPLPPTVLAYSSMVLDATQLYWVRQNADSSHSPTSFDVEEVSIGGGSPSIIGSTDGQGSTVAVGDGYVYWSMNYSIVRERVGAPPTTPMTVYQGATPIVITADSMGVYWTSADNTVIEAIGVANPLVVAGGQTSPGGIAVDAGNVYWYNFDVTNGSIVSVPKAGGNPVVLASGIACPSGIAVGSADVYWITSGTATHNYSDGTVMKVSKRGGAPVVLATGQINPGEVVVDDTSVYWTNEGSPPDYANGSIMKLTPK